MVHEVRQRPPRRRHPLYEVAEYWRQTDRLPDAKFRWIGLGEPSCFRCGWMPPVPDAGQLLGDHPKWPIERRLKGTWKLAGQFLDLAHLEDFCAAGDDEVSNVLPLCHLCHREMPDFDKGEGPAALAWVERGKVRTAAWQLATDLQQPETRRALPSMYRSALEEIAAHLTHPGHRRSRRHTPA